MSKDPYKALWVSYSSISNFLDCPRAYFLANVYKDPATNHKVSMISPAMALGQVVHEVIESLSVIPVETRFDKPLHLRLEQSWKKIEGKKGGFTSPEQEEEYKRKGQQMLTKIRENPGPLKNLAVKVKQELPYYWLSEEDEIILCGKIDWLEYLPDIDAVHIIDFKTGKKVDNKKSLQLPIYLLLVKNVQKRKVVKLSYWYLMEDETPEEMELPDENRAYKEVMAVAKKIKLARKLDKLTCPTGGCQYCKPYETILEGKATLVDVNEYNQDVYVLSEKREEMESEIL